jgi:Fur family peroxide stress response transcriptional regulator
MKMNKSTRLAAMERFERVCRERALPFTIQRRVVFETLLDSSDHPTADDVHRRARSRIPGIAQTTVYRVLETLVQLGLARRVHHPDSVLRYEGNVSRHDHLRCTECQRVIDVAGPPTEIPRPRPERLDGFEVRACTVVYEGICPACLASSRGARTEER